ncbi:MAG: CDP-alcohol phosphatidyltransferase family protein [Gammaproteobacteria bacterium]|nr:CDP-alcohol phosphatidyltransferase family protein [Gammaproteobacteria bacterium]
MIESYCRPYCQRFFIDPPAKILARLPYLLPNHISIGAMLLGLMIIPLMYAHHTLWAVTVLLLSGYFDALDGTVARASGRSSAQGTMLDIVSDRVVEFAVIFALFLADPLQRGAWCLLMLGAVFICVTSFLVVGIFHENTSHKGFHYSPGLIERFEAFLFFIAMMLFPTIFVPLAALFSLLVLYTAIVRITQFITVMAK